MKKRFEILVNKIIKKYGQAIKEIGNDPILDKPLFGDPTSYHLPEIKVPEQWSQVKERADKVKEEVSRALEPWERVWLYVLSSYNMEKIGEVEFLRWVKKNENILRGNEVSWLKLTREAPTKYRHDISIVGELEGEDRKYIYLNERGLDFLGVLDAEVIREGKLMGEGSIHEFKYYIVKESHEIGYEDLVNKDIGQDYYIAQALADIKNGSLEDKNFMRLVNEFIKKNKIKIDGIRRLFRGQPRYLGSGSDGAAFAINEAMVLKIFRSEAAYEAAVEVIKRLHKRGIGARTEAMIYDAGEMGEFKFTPIYYYIIEKLKPVEGGVDKEYEMTIERVIKHIVNEGVIILRERNNRIREYNDKSDVKVLNEIIEGSKREISEEMLRDRYYREDIYELNNSGLLAKRWLPMLIEEIMVKLLSKRTDLHIGNIGINGQGYLRYFDPAFN